MDSYQPQKSQTGSQGKSDAAGQPTAKLEPTSVSVPIPGTPWYKRLIGAGTQTQTVWKLSFVMLFLMAVLVTLKFQQPRTLETNAGANRARVTLLPARVILPPDTSVQLWATTGVPVTQGQFELSFDPTKISIVEAKLPDSSPLTDTVTMTPPKQANITGKIFVVLSPAAQKIVPPTGTFEVLDITFHSKSATNVITEVGLVPDNTKLYNGKTPFVITGAFKSTFILEPGQ